MIIHPLFICARAKAQSARVIFAGPLASQLGRTSHRAPHMQIFSSHEPIWPDSAQFPKTPTPRSVVGAIPARCLLLIFFIFPRTDDRPGLPHMQHYGEIGDGKRRSRMPLHTTGKCARPPSGALARLHMARSKDTSGRNKPGAALDF